MGEVVENIFVNWEETLKKWFARDEKHQRGRNQPIGTRVDTIKIETECMTNLKKIRQEIYSGTTAESDGPLKCDYLNRINNNIYL